MGESVENKRKGVVLICDDHDDTLTVVEHIVREAGYTVFTAHGHTELMPLVDLVKPDLLLCDIRMPEVDGLDIAERLKSRGDRFPVVLMTAHDSSFYHAYAPFIGATEIISKPIIANELLRQIDLALGFARESTKTLVLDRLRILREKNAEPKVTALAN